MAHFKFVGRFVEMYSAQSFPVYPVAPKTIRSYILGWRSDISEETLLAKLQGHYLDKVAPEKAEYFNIRPDELQQGVLDLSNFLCKSESAEHFQVLRLDANE